MLKKSIREGSFLKYITNLSEPWYKTVATNMEDRSSFVSIPTLTSYRNCTTSSENFGSLLSEALQPSAKSSLTAIINCTTSCEKLENRHNFQ